MKRQINKFSFFDFLAVLKLSQICLAD